MKKSIKRTLSLLLALTMVLSLGLPAYAVGAPAEDEVVISEEPIALPEQEPVEEPVEKPVTLPIGAGKKIDFTEEEEIISNDLIVDFSDVEDELVVEAEAAPAKTFTYSESATGFTVEVSAPAGALPLGTEMVVDRLIDLSAVQNAVNNAEDLNGSVRVAADISFWLNGEEIEPAEGAKLFVRISAPEIEAIAEPVIVHIPDGENAVPEIVEQLRSGDIGMADTVSFEAASFSIYAIVSDDTLVTPRVTYHFLTELKEDKTAEPYVFLNKAGDYVDYQIVKEYNGAWEKLQNPGEPVVGLEKNFLGWFVVTDNGDGTYTYTDTDIVFDENGEAVPPVTTTQTDGDKEVYVAPRYGEAFIVTFWDKEEANATADNPKHIVAKRVVYLTSGEQYASVQVDDVDVPSAATEVLSGWTSDNYKDGTTTYTLLEKPVWDEVTKSFDLYPIFSAGHWLRFSGGPSGSGAGYRSAIFVTANTTAAEVTNLSTVSREGYTFAGWFYKGSEDNPFDGTEAATNDSGVASNPDDLLSRVRAAEGDTTLYAHWTGNEVGYKYATWFENADDTNFAYGELVPLEGKAGDPTDVEPPEVEGFHVYGSDLTNYPEETESKYTLTPDTIKGDGTTIVNVYYMRNIYEVKFYTGGSYQQTTDTTGVLYSRRNGNYYRLAIINNTFHEEVTNVSNNTAYWYNNGTSWVQVQRRPGGLFSSAYWQMRPGTSGNWTTIDFTPEPVYSTSNYTGNRYKIVPSGEITELTIRAKYGATISNMWPSRRTGLSRSYPVNWKVSPDGSVYQSNQPQMPLNGASFFYAAEGSGYIMNTYYYVQTTAGGNNFELDHLDAFNADDPGWTTTAEDYYNILGFTVNFASDEDAADEYGNTPNPYATDTSVHTSTPAGSSYERVGGYNSRTYQVVMYYLRNKYTLTFNTQKPGAATPAALTDIYYQANIAQVKSTQIAALNQQYIPGETTVTVQGEGTYIFQGWYDNADGMGEPFNFDQAMPAGNITLYAKWDRIWYLAQIDPNGGEILPGIDEVTYTWLRYGDKVERYNIRRDYVEAESSYTGTKYYYYELLASEDEHRHDSEGYYYSGYRKGFYISEDQLASQEAFVAAFPAYAGEYAASNYAMIKAHVDTDTVYKPATNSDNYAFVGWYKADIDPETDELTYTNEVYKFDPIESDTALYAKWRRSGLFSVQYHTENGTVSGLINNSMVATDSSYADMASTKIAFTPDKVRSSDGKGYVFIGWKLAEPDGFDSTNPGAATLVGDLMKQGDAFTVDANYADAGHFIHLVAMYQVAESNPDTLPVTTVSFNPNFPAGATNTSGEAKTVDGVPLNTEIDLSKTSFTIVIEGENREETIPQFSCFGWTQIGWNTQADGSGQAFKMTDIVGVDNLDRTSTNTKANVLYAIWGPAYFYVYQSSNNKVTRVSMVNMTADSVYDLTQHIDTKNFLYGGYYRDYAGKSEDFVASNLTYTNDVATDAGVAYTGNNEDITWKWDDAYKTGDDDFTGAGNAIKPVANAVYYIKEVPGANYLKHVMKFTYLMKSKMIGTSWLITNADDTNYGDIGFEIVGSELGNNAGVKTDKMTIMAVATGNKTDYKVSSEIEGDDLKPMFDNGKLMSYKLVYNNPEAKTDHDVETDPMPVDKNVDILAAGSIVRNYWVTPDGLKVTSTMVRTYNQVTLANGPKPTTVADELGSQIMAPDKTVG